MPQSAVIFFRSCMLQLGLSNVFKNEFGFNREQQIQEKKGARVAETTGNLEMAGLNADCCHSLKGC